MSRMQWVRYQFYQKPPDFFFPMVPAPHHLFRLGTHQVGHPNHNALETHSEAHFQEFHLECQLEAPEVKNKETRMRMANNVDMFLVIIGNVHKDILFI